MIKLTQTGVGTADVAFAARDSNGSGQMPLQVDVTGTATFLVLARVSPEASWQELIAPTSGNTLQSVAWVPYVRLEVTAGTGTATLWLGEQ